MNIMNVLNQMLVLFVMMAIGYFCYQKKWVNDTTSSQLSKLIVNVTNPILIVNGVLSQQKEDAGNGIWWNIGFVFIYYVLLISVSFVIPWIIGVKKQRFTTYQMMTIFGNVAFMGIPVIRGIYGNGAMIYIAFYILVYNILLYTIGVILCKKASQGQEGHKEKGAWKSIMNPGVVASILAVVIFAFGIKVPDAVQTFCDYMGGVTIPLSMIIIGISLVQANLKEVFKEWKLYLFVLLRMIVLPIGLSLIGKGFVSALEIPEIVFGIFVIQLGMPVGSVIVMLAKEYNADSEFCTKGVVISTLASILTIPVICMFL